MKFVPRLVLLAVFLTAFILAAIYVSKTTDSGVAEKPSAKPNGPSEKASEESRVVVAPQTNESPKPAQAAVAPAMPARDAGTKPPPNRRRRKATTRLLD